MSNANRYKNKAFTLRINESIISSIKLIAEEENRTVTKQIEYVLSRYVADRITAKKKED